MINMASSMKSPRARRALCQMGVNLKTARLKRRIAVKDFAYRVGVSDRTIMRLEKGDAVSVREHWRWCALCWAKSTVSADCSIQPRTIPVCCWTAICCQSGSKASGGRRTLNRILQVEEFRMATHRTMKGSASDARSRGRTRSGKACCRSVAFRQRWSPTAFSVRI